MARYLKWLLRSVACWAHAHTESTGDTWNELTSQRHDIKPSALPPILLSVFRYMSTRTGR